jgi:hypothetical protein
VGSEASGFHSIRKVEGYADQPAAGRPSGDRNRRPQPAGAVCDGSSCLAPMSIGGHGMPGDRWHAGPARVSATSSSQLEAYAPGGMETDRRARAPTRESSSAGRSGPACSVSQRAYVSTGIVDRTSLPLGQARRRPLRTSMVSVSPGGTHPTGMARDAPTSPCPIRSHAQSSMANGIYPLRPRRLRAPRSHAQTGMTGRVSTPPLDRPARLRSRLPLGVLRRLASSL